MAAEAYGRNSRTRLVPFEKYAGDYSTPVFRPSSRRTSSSFSISSPPPPTIFSSSSSFSNSSNFNINESSFYDDSFHPFTPNTPLTFSSSSTSSSTAGIPFSWEQLPGIPKDETTPKKKNNNTSLLLPLPPAVAGNNKSFKPPRKYHTSSSTTSEKSFRKDPFFAAMAECSKDHHELWKTSNLTKTTVSHRFEFGFGFVNMMYTSCKRTCTVSESIVYLPTHRSRTSTSSSSSSYNMLTRRPT